MSITVNTEGAFDQAAYELINGFGPNVTATTIVEPVFTHTITFSKYPVGTHITTQYENDGIKFGGDMPFITTDGANPTSPVLSGTPKFMGAIDGTFVFPNTDKQAGVHKFALDAGYFNNLHSTKLSWYDEAGKLLGSETNSAFGIEHFGISSATLIGSWRIAEIGNEHDAYAIDNVAFNTPC
jgi:hypothetical protein